MFIAEALRTVSKYCRSADTYAKGGDVAGRRP